jgi:HD domain-containing protein/GAF domain-containing protein
MPLSFVSRHDGDRMIFTALSGDHARFGLQPGDAVPLAESHCRRMLDGDISCTVPDLAADPVARDMRITRAIGLRAYAGVPIHLPDGSLYGTLCAVDARPSPGLGAREAELLRFLAQLVADLIQDDAEDHRAQRQAVSDTGVRALLGALEARDFYTGEHSREVVALAVGVARRLDLPGDAVRDVEQVALLHDIGKVGIPDAILQKQGPLDEREWQVMRQHPVVGERIIVGTAGLTHLAPAMRAEHERWDGGGYPDGLRGEDIPLASRITLACDAYHAMTSDRPYRPSLSERRAREELRRCAGTQFDPQVVEALLQELGPAGAHEPRAARTSRAPSAAPS